MEYLVCCILLPLIIKVFPWLLHPTHLTNYKQKKYWCLVLGAWCLVLGAWCLVLGAWCLVLGAWCLVLGAWYFFIIL
jgi:hypothetical protein